MRESWQVWFHLQWADTWEAVDIVVEELVPIVIVAGICGSYGIRSWYSSAAPSLMLFISILHSINLITQLNMYQEP